MNNVKWFIFSVLFTAFSVTSVAAQQISSSPSSHAQKIGTISESGAGTLEELQANLADKAMQAGATAYRITSVVDNDKIYGTANIYK